MSFVKIYVVEGILKLGKGPLIIYYGKHECDRNMANSLILSEIYIPQSWLDLRSFLIKTSSFRFKDHKKSVHFSSPCRKGI